MKKVLLVLLFLITLGGGIFGTLYFRNLNNDQIEANLALQQQSSQLQAQLNTIGQMTTVYEVNGAVRSGSEILDSDLVAVSIPISALSDASITDKSLLVGKYYKIGVNKGTILTKDLIMDEYNTSLERYQLDLPLSYFPVGMFHGDYIDIRLALPNGEQYIVIEHKKVQMVQEKQKVVTINVSEEEHWCWQAALVDLATYGDCGVFLFVTKYLNPGLDTGVASYYPIQEEMVELALVNPNITDTTRIVNESLRAHIDEVLFFADSSDNQVITQAYKAILQQHATIIHSGHEEFIEKFKNEEGDIMYGDAANSYGQEAAGGASSGGQSFDQAVGDAIDSLQQSTSGLGGL